MEPKFFATGKDFRKWLSKNFDKLDEQWIGYYKKATKKPSITWPESVDVALCFGWIDGLRKKIDEEAYMIRFTPRKPNSHWSVVNLKRVKELKKEGLMEKSGLAAYAKRKESRTAKASYEQKNVKLAPEYLSKLKADKKAWGYFDAKAPSYKKQCIWWVMSAKQEATRVRRLEQLIESSGKEEVIPLLRWSAKK
ncbi:MAG: YdeI/OmpD-associated family protein [Cyclobacteriaceae bacterium]